MTAIVALAPGEGRLVRRPRALLFLPRADSTLAAAFGEAPDGGELQALASATVAEGFAVGGFVAVDWHGPLTRVMVFGDVAVETDQPSLPMLTGSGSRTWVEHSLPLERSAVVTVGPADDLAADTALEAGTAIAGGFSLRLAPAIDELADAAPAEGTVDADPAPTTDPAPPVAEPASAPGSTAEPTPVPVVDATAAVPRPAPPAIDPADPAAALLAIQAAAMNDEGLPALADVPVPEAPRPVDAPPPLDDPDVTLPPPDVAAVRAEIGRAGESLVDAKVCSRHHLNPPSVAACGACGELLAPGDGAVVHVPQPPLGSLRFDDGAVEPLDADLVLGRNPARGDTDDVTRRPVRVPGDKVSRRHLEVRRQGWDVIVTDLGSTNGSFVVPHPGGPVLALETGRPQLVEPGATIYFGSRSFVIVARSPGAS